MKKLFFIMVASLVFAPMSAKVWRVNPSDGISSDFKSVQAALDSAILNDQGGHDYYVLKAGDTLYCEPGGHGNATIDRSITLIGSGYGDVSNGVQVGNDATFGNIYLHANNINLVGLNVSLIYGSEMVSGNYPEYCNIERCHIRSEVSIGYCNYMTIKNCCISLGSYSNMSAGTSAQILGNIFYLGSSYNKIVAAGSTIQNNTFLHVDEDSFDALGGCAIKDNIMLFSLKIELAMPDFTSNSVHNNIIATTGGEEYDDKYPNNLYGVKYTEEYIFELKGDQGARYRIKAGHVALTYSTTGGKIGAYGGNYPYEPTQRPLGMPYIYDVKLEQDNKNQTIKLNFKAKSQNE